jgi:glutamate dehydrogenase
MTPSIQSAADADEAKGALCLDAAGDVLKARQADAALLSFFAALFRNATPEDVTRYTPDALAALARLVFARVQSRKPGETLVNLFSPAGEAPEYGSDDAILVAVNPDAPFLFDSLVAALTASGAHIRALFHPVIMLNGAPVSVIVAVLAPVNPARANILTEAASAAFTQVREAVRDWRAMQARMGEAILELKDYSQGCEDLAESIAFLEWLADNHFTFLGARDYRYDAADGGNLIPVTDSGLGVLSSADARVIQRGTDRIALTPHHHQIQRAQSGPSPCPYGLCRGQDFQ